MPILPKIFIAYAHEDKLLLKKLRTHLNVMKRQQRCEIFFDGEIMPGETWDKRLKDELHAAHIFVLLVTEDFLDSDYVNETELPKILERRSRGEAEVVAVILKDCLWDLTELKDLQVVLKDEQPIEHSGSYAHAAREVFRVIEGRNKREAERRLEEAHLKTETLRHKQEAEAAEQQSQKPDFSKILPPGFSEAEAAEQQSQKPDFSKILPPGFSEDEHHRLTLDPFHDLMVHIEGGTFKMGDEHGDLKHICCPVHEVIVNDFKLCKHPVTQAQWQAIMNSDPLNMNFKGCESCPVEGVSWNDVQEFIEILNRKTRKNYRLPSEAEWEFAARGGNQSKKYKFSGSNQLNEIAWHSGNSDNKTQPVMDKRPNELGLYDMTGNVWEWCQDVWHDNYSGAPKDGSAWNSGGDQSRRVVRGGSWHDDTKYCRIASRSRFIAGKKDSGLGFRLAL